MKNTSQLLLISLLTIWLFGCQPTPSKKEVVITKYVSSILTNPWQEEPFDYLEPGAETTQTIEIDTTLAAQTITIPNLPAKPEAQTFTKADWNRTRALWLQIRNAFAAGSTSIAYQVDEEIGSGFDYYLLNHIFCLLQQGARYLPIEGAYINDMDITQPDAMAFLNPDGSIIVIIGNTSKRWHAATIHLAGKTFTPEVRDFSYNTLMFRTKI